MGSVKGLEAPSKAHEAEALSCPSGQEGPEGPLETHEAGALLLPFRAGRPRVGAGAEAALLALAILVRRTELASVLAVPASCEGETEENQEEDTDQPLHIDGLPERVIVISGYPTENGPDLEARRLVAETGADALITEDSMVFRAWLSSSH